MARLIFRDSQGREGTVELSPTETVYVGRGLECAIRTDDGMVSRRHAQFRNENGRFVVEDLGSANGTHLNNTRVQKQALGHADVIQCGSLMIRFVDEGAVNIVQQPAPMGMGGPVPPKKGGTMVIEPNQAPPPLAGGYGQPAPSGFGSQPGPPPGYGVSPAGPTGYGSQPGVSPYGGPPVNPLAQTGVPPYGGPPQMPSGGSIPPANNPS